MLTKAERDDAMRVDNERLRGDVDSLGANNRALHSDWQIAMEETGVLRASLAAVRAAMKGE